MPSRAGRLAGGLAAVTVVLSTAACVTVVAGPSQGTACSWTNAAPAAQQVAASSDVVVLVDDTASFWPKEGQRLPLPGDPVSVAVSSLVQDFATGGTRLVSFGTFDGSSTTIDWQLTGVTLPSATGTSDSIRSEQNNARNCLTSVVRSALSAAPQAPGTDVMAALAAAGQQLQGAQPSDDHVLLITDGLSNAGCLNLSDVISQGKSASTVLGACSERAELTLLRGTNVQLAGVGFQAAQPSLDSAEQAWVESYWIDMCAGLHVATASCVARTASDVDRVSVSSRLPDPAIKFPTIPVPKAGSSVVPVPADLLFAFDSSKLSASGEAYLGILAGELRARSRTIKQVIGHTDQSGSKSYNLGLSQRRAEAVGNYLSHLGFTGITAAGVGEAGPACSPQYTTAGAPIPSCMAEDRRVQLMLGG